MSERRGPQDTSFEFAIVVPVGPGQAELIRLCDLYESARLYGQGLRYFVVVDDHLPSREFSTILPSDPKCDVVTLANPRRGRGIGNKGGLASGILSGMEWVYRNTNCAFALKLDTDTLVINDLASLGHLAGDCVGQAGTIGRTPDREQEPFGWESACQSPICVTYHRHCASSIDTEPRELALALEALRPDIERAISAAYSAMIYCQGGGYMITRLMMARLSSLGCFDRAMWWMHFPIGEDVILSMYTYVTQLKCNDASRLGEPFASQWKGLAFSPEQLLTRGHAIIHSVKNDEQFSEQKIRAYYKSIRNSQPITSLHWHFYVNLKAVDLLRNNRKIIILFGAYDADINFGRLSALYSIKNYYSRRTELALIPAVEASFLLSETAAHRFINNGPCPLLILSRIPLPVATMERLGVTALRLFEGVRAFHITGGAQEQFADTLTLTKTILEVGTILKPERYVATGLDIEEGDVEHYWRLVRGLKGPVLGCSNYASIEILRRDGIPAVFTGLDNVHGLVDLVEHSSCIDGPDRRVAFDIALVPRFYSAETEQPEQRGLALRKVADVFNHLRERRLRSIVLINSNLDIRTYHNTWSTFSRIGFVEDYRQCTQLDLVELARKHSIQEIGELVRQVGVSRFVGTNPSVVCFFAALGIPSHLLVFNAFGRRAATSMGQSARTVSDFFDQKHEALIGRCRETAEILASAAKYWCNFLDEVV
jgi:hypothetical protein